MRILHHLRALTLGILIALVAALSSVFKTRAALQLENLALRHQLAVLHRSVKKPKLTPLDRLLWAWLYGVWADWRSALIVVKPETVIGGSRKFPRGEDGYAEIRSTLEVNYEIGAPPRAVAPRK